MKLLKREEKQFVKIVIGIGKTGKTSIHAPTKTISIEQTTVMEMYNKILKLISESK